MTGGDADEGVEGHTAVIAEVVAVDALMAQQESGVAAAGAAGEATAKACDGAA